MKIPIFYWIRTANTETLQEMKESRYPEQQAKEEYQKYIGDKKKYLKRIKIFGGIFLFCTLLVILGGDFLPNEGYVFIPILIAIFTGVFGMIFSANNYMVSNQYLTALKEGYPQIAQREDEKLTQ